MADPSLAATAYTQPAPGDLTQEQQSAKAVITSLLAEYGLEALATSAWNAYLTGKPIEQIMLELRQTPEYKARFPGMDALSKKGRAISEREYIETEKQYVSLFRQAGLPAGFYDAADDFGSFIANEVSPQEMSGRLDVARRALYETPPQVRDELARLYDLGAGDVMAFLLDPNKALPVLEQKFVAAQAGAASRLSGYGMLTTQEAESLGYSNKNFDQLTQGFDFLANASELFNPILGEASTDQITRDEQLSIVGGSGNAAARRLEKRAKERAAQFQGGGSFAATQRGVTGLGSAAS